MSPFLLLVVWQFSTFSVPLALDSPVFQEIPDGTVGGEDIPRRLSDAPFTVVAGDGCYVFGKCLASSRRRRYFGSHEGCTVEVSDGIGPLFVPEFHTSFDDEFQLNGYTYRGIYDLGPNVRPIGTITWTTREAEHDDFNRIGWTICAGAYKKSTSGIVRDAWNGGNRAFDYPADATAKTVALLACESEYGLGTCREGHCGCFRYYYRRDGGSCGCDKAEGDYEWVFTNDGCTAVSQDFSFKANELGGILLSSATAKVFVRRKVAGCGEFSWELTLPEIRHDIQLPQRHLLVDLRSSHYEPGSATWFNLVQSATDANGAVPGTYFDSYERSFLFGSSTSSDAIQVKLPEQTPEASWVFWAKFPLPGPGEKDLALQSIGCQRSLHLANASMRANEWSQIVVIFERISTTIFLNGKVTKVTEPSEEEAPQSGDTLLLGAAGSAHFDKKTSFSNSFLWVSDLAIFNRRLAPLEVHDLYAQGRPSARNGPIQERNCRFNEELDGLMERVVNLTYGSIFEVTSGTGCYVHGNCVATSRRRRAFNENEACSVRVHQTGEAPTFTFHEFQVQENSDDLNVFFHGYEERFGLFENDHFQMVTVAPDFNIDTPLHFAWSPYIPLSWDTSFFSDDVNSWLARDPAPPEKKWEFCAHRAVQFERHLDCLLSNGEDAEMDLLSALLGPSTTSCAVLASSVACHSPVLGSLLLHQLCPLSCNTTSAMQTQDNTNVAKASSSWQLISGNCQTIANCATSPLYPLIAATNESCALALPSDPPMLVSSSGSGGGAGLQTYNGTSWEKGTPSGAGVIANEVLWNPGNESDPGWKLCSASITSTSCGVNCARSAHVSCPDHVVACSSSVLQTMDISEAAENRPHAAVVSCSTSAYIDLDLGRPMTMNAVDLHSGLLAQRFCGRAIALSDDGNTWDIVFKQGPGFGPAEQAGVATMQFARQSARYVRVFSSRSFSEPVARFSQVAISDICEDDESWTDSVHGDGSHTCFMVGQSQAWCFLRGAYSLEAQRSCPYSCGVCTAPFHAMSNHTCSSATILDETRIGDHIVSAQSCFRHCLSTEQCTHFDWQPGESCRRYRGCHAVQHGSGAPTTYVVQKIAQQVPRPIVQMYVRRDWVSLRSSGRCVNDLNFFDECRNAAKALGTRFDSTGYWDEIELAGVHGRNPKRFVCKMDPAADIVIADPVPDYDSSWEREECSPTYPCVCSDPSHSASGAPSQEAIKGETVLIPTRELLTTEAATDSGVTCISKPGSCHRIKRRFRRSEYYVKLGSLYPFPVDFDNDGDYDLLLGRKTGELVYLENFGGNIDFSAALGIAKRSTSTNPCYQNWADARGFCPHWCCTFQGDDHCLTSLEPTAFCEEASAWGVKTDADLIPVAFDVDGDSDIDLLIATCNGNLEYWRRDGVSNLTKVADEEGHPFVGLVDHSFHETRTCLFPEVADWDGDGDMDLLLGTGAGRIEMFQNEGGVFKRQAGSDNPFSTVHVEGYARPSAVDWDNDGDLDLLVGAAKSVEYFERTELGILVYVGPIEAVHKGGLDIVDDNFFVRAFDWDSNGEMDILIVTDNGDLSDFSVLASETTVDSLFERTQSYSPFGSLDGGPVPIPQIVDVDNDNKLDLLIVGVDGKVNNLEEGHDTWTSPPGSAFTHLFLSLEGISAQHTVDWDGDGDVDVLVVHTGGEVVFHEYDAKADRFAPGRALMSSLPAGPDTYPALHAVDWDRDGDMDLIIGDSGELPPLSVRFEGFPLPDWNVQFQQQGPEMFIGGTDIYVSETREWVFAFCRADRYWFIFPNISGNLERNIAGTECHGAAARGLVTTSELEWEVLDSILGNTTNGKQTVIVSDGSTQAPHCNTCSQMWERPECATCSLSSEMEQKCASELCRRFGHDTAAPLGMAAEPREECSCVSTDPVGEADLFGKRCDQYRPEWCGFYDTDTFRAVEMCCLCGGGSRRDGSGVHSWVVKAGCSTGISNFVRVATARIAGMKPSLSEFPMGTLRFFERTSSTSLVERNGTSNPFQAVELSRGSRTFPFVVDWNRDNRSDLVLGSASKLSGTIVSDGTPEKPHCGWSPKSSSCNWLDSQKSKCARRVCQASGYFHGVFADGFDLCRAISGTGASYFVETDQQEIVTEGDSARQVYVRCLQGGFIRYFEQQESGTLEEKLGEMNPFSALSSWQNWFAVVNIVDFDRDGEWEVVVNDDTGVFRYFKHGELCEQSACNGRGLCNRVYGTCECIDGHTFRDCSLCEEGYFHLESLQAIVSKCLPCPGLGSEDGLCAGRGSCYDDSAARSARRAALAGSNGSLPSLGTIAGTGECTCSPFFSGTDERGLSSCAAGACPPGQELILQEGTSIRVCSPCAPGYEKTSESNSLCEPCEPGRFSSTSGASQCNACPSGRFQDKAGQDSCKICLLGTASKTASTSCAACPIGRYAGNAEMSECSQCPPGTWSDEQGAEKCQNCESGKSGRGIEPCQICERGRYSEVQGTSACLLCAAGRYSSASAATSVATCEDCGIGRFSQIPGASSQDNCQMCPEGATTAAVASATSMMCIQPTRDNFTCVSGHHCQLTLKGNSLQSSHTLAIRPALPGAALLEGGISDPTEDGTTYHWPGHFLFDGGIYDLMWCPGVHGPCSTETDFTFKVGHLLVTGPVGQHFTCTRGKPCINLGPVAGYGLAAADRLQLQGSCGFGPAVAISSGNLEGYALNLTVKESTAMTFGFGWEPVSASPSDGAYQVCWCGHQIAGGCTTQHEFSMAVGTLTIQGPKTGQEVDCYLGQYCRLPGIQGVNVTPGDRLMVLNRCGSKGQAPMGVPAGGVAETKDGENFEFLTTGEANHRSTEVLQSIPGLYKLCYCKLDSWGCRSPADFSAEAGFFKVNGPYNYHSLGCFAGSLQNCTLMNMRGIGLGTGDELELQLSSSVCGTAPPDGQANHPSGTQFSQVIGLNKGRDFSFGTLPYTASPGRYRLCWRHRAQSSGKYLADAGLLFVSCPSGTYRAVTQVSRSCEACPIGFYCPGGHGPDGWEDDRRTSCPSGSTTARDSSETVAECLCSPGFYRANSGECAECQPGRYKSVIANNESCTEQCPNGTTSSRGARSADQCYSKQPGLVSDRGNLTQAEVFALEGVLQIPACLAADLLRATTLQLQQVMADTLRIRPSEVTLTVAPEASDCFTQNGTSRRLQSQDMRNLTYTILQASEQEAEILRANINVAEIQTAMQTSMGVVVISVAPPSVSAQVLDCSTRGAGLAFSLGIRPTSLDECTCAAGFGSDDNGVCQICEIGEYKGDVGPMQCSLCNQVSVGSSTGLVRLTTLTKGTIEQQSCTCPAGYYSPQTATVAYCEKCGADHFCSGGSAREQCPDGTTTFGGTEVAKSIGDCVCVSGLTPVVSANASRRCEQCIEGRFKEVDGNMPCSDICPPNSNSKAGSKSRKDCYCSQGWYHDNVSDTCKACPADGVSCPGGFDPPDSRVHAAPASLPGYYLTGFALAEQCYIETSDGASVCLGGATADKQRNACGGLQAGPLCAACQHLSARDLGDEACSPCEGNYADWMHIINLNFDLILKAAFGIFLGKQAIDSAATSRRMVAVILRILLQWITVNSVLGTFDLSTVRIFDWSIADQAGSALADDETVVTASAASLSFTFRFPKWFQSVWRRMMSIVGTIPGPVSPQFSLECLIQGQQKTSALPSQGQLLGPACWWILYPLLVMTWVAITCLLIAKVAFPMSEYLAKAQKKKLTQRLSAAGAKSNTSLSMVEVMGTAQVRESLQASDKELAETMGGETYVEVASKFLVEHAGPPILDMLEGLVRDARADTETLDLAKQALTGGLEFLPEHVESIIRAIRRDDSSPIAKLFDEPLSVPPLLQKFLMEKGIKAGDPDQRENHPLTTNDQGRVYKVFGLFRNTSAATVLKDAFPLYLVTMYSIWDVVTRRLLGLLQVKTILVANSNHETIAQGRWLYDMRFSVFQGNHVPVGVVALIGLSIWSVVFLVVVFRVLKSGKYLLQEKSFIRMYGYFYNGLEPNMYWWEVAVKKGDILMLYIITFTEMFHDPKAKLIMYLGCAGFFWAAHNMYHPYDDRQNKLADRLEDLALLTRFLTVFALQILIMVSQQPLANTFLAIAIVVLNIRYLCIILFVLVVELPDDTADSSVQKGKLKVPVLESAGFAGARILNCVVENSIGPVVKLMLKAVHTLVGCKHRAAKKVPHIMWQGPGRDLVVITHQEEQLQWCEDLFNKGVSSLYKLGIHDQKAYVANTISQFWEHILNNSDCHQLPACIMDIFFLLPSALREEASRSVTDPAHAFHVRVARRIYRKIVERRQANGARDCSIPPEQETVLAQRGGSRWTAHSTSSYPSRAKPEQEKIPSLRDKTSSQSSRRDISRATAFSVHGVPENAHSGEDFNAALLFIQRLSRNEVHEFMIEAAVNEAGYAVMIEHDV